MSDSPSSANQRRVARATALYRRLLVLYPASFRQVFGSEMVQVFRDSCRQAEQERGSCGLLDLWLSTVPDLVFTALAERLMEGKMMARFWVIRACGLLTMINIVPFSVLLIDGDVVSTHLIPGYSGLLSELPTPPGTLAERFVYLGLLLSPALCFLCGALGLWLLQRSWPGRIAGALAFLGPLVSGFLWLLTDGFSYPVTALVLLGVGLLLCGICTLRSRLLPRWNAVPLLLGLCMVAYALRGFIWEFIPLPGFAMQSYWFFSTVGYLVIFFLWGALGYALWAWRAEQEPALTQIQAG